MAADITSPAAALQAATLLVPKAQQDANPFFSNAARHLMSAALLALILQAPGRWTLRHLLLVLRSESLLRQVLAQTEFTRPLLQYGEHAATFQNILSTLLTDDLWHDGQLVIPAGSELHGKASINRLRERITSSGAWTVVWQSGLELVVEGIALDREEYRRRSAWTRNARAARPLPSTETRRWERCQPAFSFPQVAPKSKFNPNGPLSSPVHKKNIAPGAF